MNKSEIAEKAAREIRLMLSNVAGPISLMNGKFDGTIAAIVERAIAESRSPEPRIKYTRHAESSLDGCDPKSCQNGEHFFYELGDGEPSPEIRHYTCEFVDTKDDPPIMTEEPYDGALEGEWRKFICPICHERVILLFKAGWERKIRPLREAADKAARTLGENLSANSGAAQEVSPPKESAK